MLKNAFRQITPPLIWGIARSIKEKIEPEKTDEEQLFDGHSTLFVEEVRTIRTYGEYGVGLSTEWIDRHTTAMSRSVDTSREWIEKTQSKLTRKNTEFFHIEVGELLDWGYPATYAHRSEFLNYAESIWTQDNDLDLVLVDGRFRVSCFLTSLLRARPGCKIVFDDYTDRPHYKLVEEFLEPTRTSGRQALFIVPEQRDTELVEATRDAFVYVRD